MASSNEAEQTVKKVPQVHNKRNEDMKMETTLKTAITTLVLLTTWTTVASTVAAACPF